MSASLRTEERRLTKIFVRALLITGALPVAIPLACTGGGADTVGAADHTASSSSAAGGGGGGGGVGGGDVGADAGSDVDSKCAPEHYLPDIPDKCGNYVHLRCGLS